MEPYSIEDELEEKTIEEDDCVTNDELDCIIEELDNITELESSIDELDCGDSDEKFPDDESPIAEELNAIVELESFTIELEEPPSTSTIVE